MSYESWSLMDSTDFAHASSASQNQQREDWEWALGIALCLAGAACTNLGLTFQKYSFILNDRLALHEQKAAMNQVWWLIGMSVFMVGQVLNLIAFGYTSQALAAVLGSFSLVTNGIFAPLILKEKLTKTIVFSIAVIVAGSILVVLASSHATQDYTLDELISLYKRDLFIGYMTVLTIAMIACLIIMFREDREWEKQKAALDAWEQQREVAGLEYDDSIPSPVSVGSRGNLQQDPEMAGKGNEVRTVAQSSSSLGKNSETAALIGVKIDSPPPELKIITPSPLTPIVAGAILSSCSVLFGKCSVQLLKTSFYGSNQFVYPLSWFLTAIFLTCAVMAVVYLNIGMRRGTALFVVPLYYVLNTVLAILGGLIYFEEFQHFSKVQGFLFGIGVIVTVVGVWVGSRGQVGDESSNEEELDVVARESSVSPGSSESPPSAGGAATTTATRKMPAKSALASSSTPSVASTDSSEWADDSFQINTVIPSAGAAKSAAASSSSAAAESKPVRKKSVRFGAGNEDEDSEEAALIGPGGSRMVRANSAPDQGAITDEEFRAMLREEPRASLAYDNTLSTPQPNTRYGSVASSMEAVQSRTPGAPTAAVARRGAMDEETRRKVWERLTPAQKETLRQRDAALAAADGRRRKYSYSRAAYRGSFRAAGDERKTGERRYSVAFIGLGVS